MSPNYPNNPPPDWQPPAQRVTVPVKSAAKSKINVLAAGVLAVVGGYVATNGLPITTAGWLGMGAAIGYPLLNIVLRTWFTTSLTKESAEKM